MLGRVHEWQYNKQNWSVIICSIKNRIKNQIKNHTTLLPVFTYCIGYSILRGGNKTNLLILVNNILMKTCMYVNTYITIPTDGPRSPKTRDHNNLLNTHQNTLWGHINWTMRKTI